MQRFTSGLYRLLPGGEEAASRVSQPAHAAAVCLDYFGRPGSGGRQLSLWSASLGENINCDRQIWRSREEHCHAVSIPHKPSVQWLAYVTQTRRCHHPLFKPDKQLVVLSGKFTLFFDNIDWRPMSSGQTYSLVWPASQMSS